MCFQEFYKIMAAASCNYFARPASAWVVILFVIILCSGRGVVCVEDNYPPGYIGALNSTIQNLMTQLRTYQEYINQAFVPLKTYDQVFPKPFSTFKQTPPASTPTAKDEKEEPTSVAARLIKKPEVTPAQNTDNTRETKKSRQFSENSRTSFDERPDSDSVQFSNPATEDDFDDSDADGVIRVDVRHDRLKSKRRKYEQKLLAEPCGIFDPISTRANDGDGHILWPWSVTLGKEMGHGFLYRCGGTLITLQHVITAAHCLNENNEVNALRLYGIKVRVEEAHIHPNYKEELGYNDIAILKLVKPLNQTSITQLMPICVVPPNTDLRDALEKVDGFSWTTEWKYSNKDNKLRMVVRNIYTKIQDTGDCEAKHKKVVRNRESERDLFPEGFNSSVICVKSSRKDVCQRNAGISLLTRDRQSERSYLLGVVVKGEDDCTATAEGEELPGIYTRISYFIDWIFDTIVPATEIQNHDHGRATPEDTSYYYYES